MHTEGPYKIMMIRGFVPEKVKPWIFMVFFLIFQFSGGVYMSAVTQMSGTLSLMHEDVMMAGFATLVGLCLTFTVMYRLKFRFSTKTGLLITTVGLIICNIICLHTASIPLLVAISFFAGIFRMWGTLLCNSTLAPWLFPKWTMAKFQCYVQSGVMGFMVLSGLTVAYLAYYFQWHYMYWFVLGLLFSMLLVVVIAFNHFMPWKKMRLFGIDWMGAMLWGVTGLSVVFVLIYGEHYDWFDSSYIWTGIVFAVVATALNVWRASFIRHPFIDNSTWTHRSVWFSVSLLFVIAMLASPSSYFEQMYMGNILQYDHLHRISYNWISLIGYLSAALFAYHTLATREWKFKTMILIGFTLLSGYLLLMYFLIDYHLPKETFYIPIFLRSAAMIIFSITFLAVIFQTVPYQKFFQALNIVTMVTACVGPMLGSAVITHLFLISVKHNEMFFGAALDSVNPVTRQIPPETLYACLHQHSMIVGMKEIYGWLCIVSLFCILTYLLRESALRPRYLMAKCIN